MLEGSSLRRRRVGRSDLATEETELEEWEVEPSTGGLWLLLLLGLWWWWRLAEDDVVPLEAVLEWRKGSLKKFQTLGSEWGLGSATAMLSLSLSISLSLALLFWETEEEKKMKKAKRGAWLSHSHYNYNNNFQLSKEGR